MVALETNLLVENSSKLVSLKTSLFFAAVILSSIFYMPCTQHNKTDAKLYKPHPNVCFLHQVCKVTTSCSYSAKCHVKVHFEVLAPGKQVVHVPSCNLMLFHCCSSCFLDFPSEPFILLNILN